MTLSTLDWIIVFSYFTLSLFVGVWASKQAGRDTKSFFLAGRNMPWWLLGVSMVATTFSTDTPNLVTDLVRQNGVSGNWGWWAFLLTGMLTVFVYAKLWHRSGVLTDIEFVPSLNKISFTVPSSTASNSIVALSVSISAIKSPAFTLSPSLTNHLDILPSFIVGDKAGIKILIVMI